MVGIVLVLVSFGLVMVYSASSATAVLTDTDPTGLVVRQAIAAVLGVAAFMLMTRMNPTALRRLSRPLFLVAVGLLVVVLVPGIGTTVNGSQRWITLGAFGQIQPSELAKLALVLWLAAAIAREPARVRRKDGLVPYLGVAAIPALLILVEPDLGTTVILLVAAAAVLAVAGARTKQLMAAGAGAVVLGGFAIMFADYRRDRLFAFIDPWSDQGGAGFQAVQAQLALGSGGVTGVGLGDGIQKAFYLPEADTDMILAAVGEELGLIGVFGVLAAFALFAITGFRIALDAPDLHLQLVAAGVTTLVVGQAVVNIAAVLGMMPVTGVPLPFISSGGSSLIVVLASAGLLVNIARRSDTARRAARAPAESRDRGGGDGRPRDAGAGRRGRAVASGSRGELRRHAAGRG